MNNKRLPLLRQIMELQFSAVELNLFLDTHPENAEALKDYEQVNCHLQPLIDEYEKNCGPLFPFSTQKSDDCWKWIEEPWPWEIEY